MAEARALDHVMLTANSGNGLMSADDFGIHAKLTLSLPWPSVLARLLFRKCRRAFVIVYDC